MIIDFDGKIIFEILKSRSRAVFFIPKKAEVALNEIFKVLP